MKIIITVIAITLNVLVCCLAFGDDIEGVGTGVCTDASGNVVSCSGGYTGGGGGYIDTGTTDYTTYTPAGPTQQELQQRAKWNAMLEANNQANAYFEKGDYENAVMYYKMALEQVPDQQEVVKNLQNAEKALEAVQKQQLKQQQTAVNVRQSVDRLKERLSRQGSAPDFDQASATQPLSAGAGLEFIPSQSSIVQPQAGAVSVDSSVVDLRGAKTLVVDPAKVSGQPIVKAQAQPPQLIPEDIDARVENLYSQLNAARRSKNKKAYEKINGELKEMLNLQSIEQRKKWHEEVMDDIRLLEASGAKYAQALEKIRQQTREEELKRLERAEKARDEEDNKLFERYRNYAWGLNPKKDEQVDKEFIANNEMLRQRQALAMRDAYVEFAHQVRQLKRQLMEEAGRRE